MTDPQGASDTATSTVRVRKYVACRSNRVDRSGGWRVVRAERARTGRYCDNRGRGRDVLRLSFSGPVVNVVHGDARRGGRAAVIIDGERRGTVSFHNRTRRIDFGKSRVFRGLGGGEHTLRLVMKRRTGFVEGFVLRR